MKYISKEMKTAPPLFGKIFFNGKTSIFSSCCGKDHECEYEYDSDDDPFVWFSCHICGNTFEWEDLIKEDIECILKDPINKLPNMKKINNV